MTLEELKELEDLLEEANRFNPLPWKTEKWWPERETYTKDAKGNWAASFDWSLDELINALPELLAIARISLENKNDR